MVLKRKEPPAGDPVPKTFRIAKEVVLPKLIRVGFPNCQRGCQPKQGLLDAEAFRRCLMTPTKDQERCRCGICITYGVSTSNSSSAAAAEGPLQQAVAAAAETGPEEVEVEAAAAVAAAGTSL